MVGENAKFKNGSEVAVTEMMLERNVRCVAYAMLKSISNIK